jgi:hypothetical protein
MNFLDVIADYIDSNDIAEVGTGLFIGELPFDKTDILSIVNVVSPQPNKSVPYYVQVVDIWGRFSAYDTGIDKLQAVFDLYHSKANYELDGYHVYLSYGMGLPQDLDRDAERRHLFKLSLAFIYRKGSD